MASDDPRALGPPLAPAAAAAASRARHGRTPRCCPARRDPAFRPPRQRQLAPAGGRARRDRDHRQRLVRGAAVPPGDHRGEHHRADRRPAAQTGGAGTEGSGTPTGDVHQFLRARARRQPTPTARRPVAARPRRAARRRPARPPRPNCPPSLMADWTSLLVSTTTADEAARGDLGRPEDGGRPQAVRLGRPRHRPRRAPGQPRRPPARPRPPRVSATPSASATSPTPTDRRRPRRRPRRPRRPRRRRPPTPTTPTPTATGSGSPTATPTDSGIDTGDSGDGGTPASGDAERHPDGHVLVRRSRKAPRGALSPGAYR